MHEYTPERRAKVDAAMAKATEPMWYVWRSGDVTIRYNNDEGDIFEIAADLSDYDATAIVAAVNAIAPYTAHIDALEARIEQQGDELSAMAAAASNARKTIDAQAERIAELERVLREINVAARVSEALSDDGDGEPWKMIADKSAAALKDTAQ